MHVLTDKWSNDFLDYHRSDAESRVRVKVWMPLLRVTDQYFERPKQLGLLINYIRHTGIRASIAKTWSRIRERHRNEKYIAIGLGTIQQAAAGSRFREGDAVVFFAYNHPRCVERVVLDDRFMISYDADMPAGEVNCICLIEDSTFDLQDTPAFNSLRGWSSFSGIDVDEHGLRKDLESARDFLRQPLKQANYLPLTESAIRERTSNRTAGKGPRLTAAICGAGNYAKVCIMPNIDRRISVGKVFDVDPIQLRSVQSSGCAQDTAGFPRDDDEFSMYFVAGYHHTHARIATHVIEHESYAIVEKPLATNMADLTRLAAASRNHPNRLFAGFHKRHLPMNRWAQMDLRCEPGDPIDYHCLVFEVPIPEYNWYRWPNSRGKLVSNGCHWIDHFLYLNNYCPVHSQSATQLVNGSVQVALSLANGAVFTMVLTNVGSTIYGKRDHIELRVPGRVVRMIDEKRYEAESSSRLLRRRAINPFDTYKRMYAEISRRIVEGEQGETEASLLSTRVTIELEDELAGSGDAVERRRPPDPVALQP